MRSPFSPGLRSISACSFIPLLRGEEAQDDRPLNERSLEQGCCFVLLDGEGAFADEAGRRFINYLLQPVELLSQTQLPDEYARILSVAQGMLPQWNHRPVDFGGITAPFNLRQPVIISTFQQPELVELAGAIRILLERWHIRAEIRIEASDSFNSQPRPPCGYLAQQLYARYPFGSGFSGMAGFHHAVYATA